MESTIILYKHLYEIINNLWYEIINNLWYEIINNLCMKSSTTSV